MSGIKDGDRVRATHGESVIIGEADSADNYGLYVSLGATDKTSVYLQTYAWTIEVIAPPIPNSEGTP